MKSLATKTLLVLSIAAGSFSFAADEVKVDEELKCKKPKSDLYDKRDSNDILNLEMMGDFSQLSKYESSHKAVLKYKEKNGKTAYMPVVITGRGNSRGSYCAFKPFRMAFSSKELRDSLAKKLDERRRNPESKEYLKYYYDEYVAAKYDLKTEGKPDKDTLFSGLGDDVKVVTHCGVAQGGDDWPGGLKVVDQDQRLLAEYYVYEVLSKLKLTIEAARLAKISYYNQLGKPVFDNKGSALPKFAFFREPPSSLAKRCGLSTKPPEGLQMHQVKTNKGSEISMYALNYFVINSDFNVYNGGKQGHNVNYLYGTGGDKFYGIYDFDLAGPVNPGRRKQTLQETERYLKGGSETFKQYLSKDANSKEAGSLISRFLKEESDMKEIIGKSILNEEYKGISKLWLELQFAAIKEAAAAISAKQPKQE
jgi:hypothetical protein